MYSLILSTATRYLLPLLLVLSVFLLFRGHNEPGGGFVGGLVAASAFTLYAFAGSVEEARRTLRLPPRLFIGGGLLLVVCSGLFATLFGLPFLTGVWGEREFPVVGKLGTPLFFDIGVYLVVLGITLLIVFSLAEES